MKTQHPPNDDTGSDFALVAGIAGLVILAGGSLAAWSIARTDPAAPPAAEAKAVAHSPAWSSGWREAMEARKRNEPRPTPEAIAHLAWKRWPELTMESLDARFDWANGYLAAWQSEKREP